MFLTLLKPKDLLHHTIPENVTNWYHDRALYSDMYVVEKRSRSSEHIIENCTYAYRFWIEGGSWLGTIPPMLLVLTLLHFKQAHQFHTCHSLFPQRSGEKVVTFQLELLIDCDLKEHLIRTRITTATYKYNSDCKPESPYPSCPVRPKLLRCLYNRISKKRWKVPCHQGATSCSSE